MRPIVEAARNFQDYHERLKKHIHTAWRVPLPPWGRFVMSVIYFTVPVWGGYHVMQWAISKSHESIGERGEKLAVKDVQAIGNKAYIGEELKTVGAGGVGAGVKLITSTQDEQMRLRKMLDQFIERDRRQRKPEDRPTESGIDAK